jgi:hypothetical protein
MNAEVGEHGRQMLELVAADREPKIFLRKKVAVGGMHKVRW